MSNLLQSEAKGSTAVEYLPRHDHAWAVGANPILRQSGRNRQTTVGSQESAASRIDGELFKKRASTNNITYCCYGLFRLQTKTHSIKSTFCRERTRDRLLRGFGWE